MVVLGRGTPKRGVSFKLCLGLLVSRKPEGQLPWILAQFKTIS